MKNEFTTIPAMALASADRWAERTAVIDGSASLTFRGVADLMVQIGQALIARGIQPGDRVAIWAPNAIAWIPVALAVQAVGAWLVPLNTRLRGEEAAYILRKTDAAMLFTVSGFLGTDYLRMLEQADAGLRALQSTVVIPNPGQLDVEGWQAFIDSGSAVAAEQVNHRMAALGPDDISDIIFTSGTTSLPKGVLLRHGASLAAYSVFNRSYGVGEGDRYLIITPFFHCFGYKAGWMMAMMHGAVTLPMAVFEGRKALELIHEQRITHMGGSPTMYLAMLEDSERSRFNLSSLTAVTISATTVPEVVVHRVRDELGVSHTFTGYGLTETHGFVSLTGPADLPAAVATTAGRIIDELEFRVVDDTGCDVPPGEDGELWVRGFNVTPGYYEDPEGTANAVVEGWLHTGDVVRVDADRYLTVTDRKKDIYIMGGFNVAPAEVEQELLKMPGVSQVAVVGAPDPDFGEVGAAFIIRAAGSDLTGEQVIAYARERLANYKVPRKVMFVEAFPVNAMGKTLKRELRQQLGSAAAPA